MNYVPRGMAIVFACGLVAIVADSLLFHYVTTTISESTQEIIAVRDHVDQLDAARDALVDAETAAQAFLLTGRPENQQSYATAAARASAILDALKTLPRSDLNVETMADDLDRLARSRLDELSRVVDAYRTANRDRTQEMVAGDKVKMEQVRNLVQMQQAYLDHRVDNLRTQRLRIVQWSKVANAAAAIVATAILIFFGLITTRHLSRRQRLEQKIQTSNIELERLVAQRTRALEDAAQSLRTELANRQEHERMLRESEERFRLLVAGVKDYAIFRLDPQGYITSWNAGAERIKGYSADEIIGKHFSIFYTEEDRQAGVPQRTLETAAREGKYEAEALRVRKDGTRFVANVVLDALRDDSQRLVGFAKITRDITERHQQQAELEEARLALAQSQKMEALGQLSGGIAHDFNNLLHVIKNAATILERRLPDANADLRGAIAMIERSADRAASLTQRLLAFSRRQPLQPQRLDPYELISGMAPLLKSAVGESVELQIEGAKGGWHVSVDPSQLETALLNLAVNARDALPKGGSVTVEVTNAFLDEEYAGGHEDAKSGQYALISVSDTGTGMTPEVIAKAFEPFFTTKELGQGTGLGLSQVYGFIKQSGGHVAIDSEVGRGTTVRLYLPRVTAATAVIEARAQPEVASTPSQGETILLVEDEDDVRTFTANVLDEQGYRVLTARDASSALAVLASSPQVDLLFTDVGLPNGIDGRQLVDEARKRWPNLKVLFTTGYARTALMHHGRLDPGIELIVKPFSQASLAKRIRKVLDERRRAA
ncbi:MAG TPA: PAS domain S-box protein [Casimicrobiaceae bacterium]|nr:PAS domain S-box protein [Casimicrobiaceae bacterium]